VRLPHPEDLEWVTAECERTNQTQEPFSGEHRLRTDRLAEALDREQEASYRLAAAFERERAAAEHLRAVDEMRSTFLQAVSHDLRTPLTTILGIALTLEHRAAGLPASDLADLLRRLSGNARRLDRLLGDLLDLDRLALAPSARAAR
jgi:K+-sensing histidine kinase KdpD